MNNVNDYNMDNFPKINHIYPTCRILLLKLIISPCKIPDNENYI